MTFTWTVVQEAAQYLFEFTRPGARFANPAPDPANALGSATVPGTNLSVPALPPDTPLGAYQVRVLGLTATGAPTGRFSDAVTVVVE